MKRTWDIAIYIYIYTYDDSEFNLNERRQARIVNKHAARYFPPFNTKQNKNKDNPIAIFDGKNNERGDKATLIRSTSESGQFSVMFRIIAPSFGRSARLGNWIERLATS